MTDEEVEVVAEELAKVGGVSWHPGRTQGALLRPVGDRYRDRARVAIAALERLRAGTQGSGAPQARISATALANKAQEPLAPESLRTGSIVAYRPPGDRRAVICRLEKLEEGRAYLVPCARPGIGWVDLDTLSPLPDRGIIKEG